MWLADESPRAVVVQSTCRGLSPPPSPFSLTSQLRGRLHITGQAHADADDGGHTCVREGGTRKRQVGGICALLCRRAPPVPFAPQAPPAPQMWFCIFVAGGWMGARGPRFCVPRGRTGRRHGANRQPRRSLSPPPDSPAPQLLMRATTHRREGEGGGVLPSWRRREK